MLSNAGVAYTRSDDICRDDRRELVAGRLVAWCQRAAGGGPARPRAAQHPRRSAQRRGPDRVNAAVKQRELWRPFGPSMIASAAERYFTRHTDSRYMTMAFPASDRAVAATRRRSCTPTAAPGCRSCTESATPRYHRLIERFGELTGVPVVLNTSLNVRGEPVVSTTEDALRTFFATGLDVLAVGDFVVRKDRAGQPAQR